MKQSQQKKKHFRLRQRSIPRTHPLTNFLLLQDTVTTLLDVAFHDEKELCLKRIANFVALANQRDVLPQALPEEHCDELPHDECPRMGAGIVALNCTRFSGSNKIPTTSWI